MLLVSAPNHDHLRAGGGQFVLRLNGKTLQWPSGATPAEVEACIGAPLRWNWLPLLRAVAANGDALREIVLIGSPQSAASLPLCAAVLRGTAVGQPAVRLSVHQPDFMCLGAVRDAIRHEVLRLRATRRGETSIDVTGGTKTASIAAAVAAMDRDAVLQYVEARGVRCYRIVAHRARTLV